MTYLEHRLAALTLPEARALNELRSLLTDARFTALVWLLEQQREQVLQDLASEKLADRPGALEHCAGSLRALQALRDFLTVQGDHPPQPIPPQRARA